MTRLAIVDRFRQPEYTGENRCTPCTIVNVAIAAVASLALGIVWAPLVVVSFALFVAVIYTRGYLVPGTPTLTKTYFPDRVLRWFDKEPMATYEVGTESGTELDVEAILQGADALEDCEDVDDLCLTAGFEAAWTREIERSDDTAVRQHIATLLGVDDEQISFDDRDRWFVAEVDEMVVGRWESHAALVADMAASTVLETRIDDWDELGGEERSALTRGLRVYLEQCPDCGGPVEFTEETAESCCRSWDVLVVQCGDCESRLFEVDLSAVEEAPV